MSAAAETEPYERLAVLAEQELALVSREQPPTLEELDDLLTERDRIVAALPPQAPACAAPALARASALQERTTDALAARVAEVRRSLGDVERGRRTARGYGGDPAARPGLFDVAG